MSSANGLKGRVEGYNLTGNNNTLIKNSRDNRQLLINEDKCDKFDYLIGVACGAIGGFIDIFCVGTPKDSILCKFTDAQVDEIVKKFAKLNGWQPRAGNENNVKSAIGFLENGRLKSGNTGYRINYDQKTGKEVNDLFRMSPSNHHMKSLGHAPDIIGLFFSVLNQFTSTSSFVSDGKLINISTESFELMGSNFISKIFCGIVNWIGHLMSDIAGSSGATDRGSGIVIPFYELFGFCNFGKFGKHRQSLATIAVMAFENGYDFRYGMAMAIPVIIIDLLIRLMWAIRKHFQYGYELKECLPTNKNADLRVMILVGNGVLCVMDVVDAGVKSEGNFLLFFMRLNIIAWFRMVSLVVKEVCIRTGIVGALEKQLLAYKRINEALLYYLSELEKIDIEAFKMETSAYDMTVEMLRNSNTDQELKAVLLQQYKILEMELPYEGDFDSFMSDKNNHLVFSN
ncbi:MAG: hypothetical protein IJT96_12075 [Lachnospiraceae bacterium]|nr:hypothetical protein [Lachnospiraceae bacterium]